LMFDMYTIFQTDVRGNNHLMICDDNDECYEII
jgi:hypothetical protein